MNEQLQGDEFAERVFKILDLYDAKEVDRIQLLIKFMEMFSVTINKAMGGMYDSKQVKTMLDSCLRRHTWMKDGTSYVGNGTYTLTQAQAMLEEDFKHIYKNDKKA